MVTSGEQLSSRQNLGLRLKNHPKTTKIGPLGHLLVQKFISREAIVSQGPVLRMLSDQSRPLRMGF